jgi:pantetheine-phosphate adenylyltransferase
MEKKLNIAVYPGTFDPITNGHVDILKRALNIFDKVIVLLAINPQKVATFSAKERLDMLQHVAATIDPTRIVVDATAGLTVNYAKKVLKRSFVGYEQFLILIMNMRFLKAINSLIQRLT